MIEHRILLFAQLAEDVGAREIPLTLPVGATVEEALDALSDQYDGVRALRARIAIAVNEQYATAQDTLRERSVIALIPPVSGG